ncbi:unnamed protein product [Polarella glacialis]|uniref:Sulfotransferase domain-containing protein n=1 Tax=Polarella glacialis TaxID=89957 RepID=A0A813FQ50_POLGL|nr:unnamed protein product [Polarella glacialis]CAE8655988.1 unnamed protein product [Polarella glacialis]
MGDPGQNDPETISRWCPHQYPQQQQQQYAVARRSEAFWSLKPYVVKWCPFGCWRRVASVAGVIACATSSYVMLNEHVEHGIFKSDTLHKHWNLAGRQAILPNGTVDSPLIVFQHIPRTSGDSMKTHLFSDPKHAFSTSSPWPSHFAQNFTETYFLAKDLETAMDPSTKLIKGYYSRRDLQTIGRKQKVFIFLRHPVERVLSLFHMIHPVRGGRAMDEATFLAAGNSSLKTAWDYSCTFTTNSMTWQLGVLAKAKQALEEAAFVGFYEALNVDFWALKESIFPSVQLPRYIPAAFWLGTWLSLPRLRVLKFSARLSDDALDSIRQHLDLDLELYEWALKRFKPELVLYTSYRSFFWEHPCYTLTLGFLLLLLTSACRCCGRAALKKLCGGQPALKSVL